MQARIRIGDIAFGGEGVGRLPDGSVVFVPFTAMGEDVTIEITEQKNAFSRGKVIALNEAGAGRIEPECRYFGRCGGCSYQHLTYETELAAKAKQFSDLIRRIGKFDHFLEPSVIGAPVCYGYRNKLRLEPANRRLDQSTGYKLDYGYYAMDNTSFLRVSSCALARPELNTLLPKTIRSPWGVQNARREEPYPLTLRIDSTGATGVYFGKPSPKLPWLNETLLDIHYRVPTGSFWQVNPPVAEKLLLTVREWLSSIPDGEILIDAYGGVGTFSIALGEKYSKRILIECDETAIPAADYNHKTAGLSSDIIEATTEAALPRVLASLHGKAPATVILDPPRGGCAPAVIQALRARPVQTLLYVSCNVATLARDLKLLCMDGLYTPVKAALFDMFPRTAHFENAVLLQRETTP